MQTVASSAGPTRWSCSSESRGFADLFPLVLQQMADFISTSDGKIVNAEAIAFLTSRIPADKGKGAPQLIVGFSAATSTNSGSLMPLSLVMEGAEAKDFLAQLSARGVDVASLKKKLKLR